LCSNNTECISKTCSFFGSTNDFGVCASFPGSPCDPSANSTAQCSGTTCTNNLCDNVFVLTAIHVQSTQTQNLRFGLGIGLVLSVMAVLIGALYFFHMRSQKQAQPEKKKEKA